MKKYKYKREHFDTQEQFDRYRERQARSQKKWLRKYEELNPEHRERRLLRQRLYSRYHHHTDLRQGFAEWLKKTYDIDDIKSVTAERLKSIVSKC